MRFKLALVFAFVVTLFALATRSLAFCTGWCEVPAAILASPGDLVRAAASHGLAVPFAAAVGWLATFLVWLVVFFILGHGARKAVEKTRHH